MRWISKKIRLSPNHDKDTFRTCGQIFVHRSGTAIGRNSAELTLHSHRYQHLIAPYPAIFSIFLIHPDINLIMSFNFTVYKGSKEGAIKESTASYGRLAAHEVLLKITHSGICGTDMHYTGQDMVLGHEGVGVVQDIGKDVTNFKM
jgi:hypothetical protein